MQLVSFTPPDRSQGSAVATSRAGTVLGDVLIVPSTLECLWDPLLFMVGEHGHEIGLKSQASIAWGCSCWE